MIKNKAENLTVEFGNMITYSTAVFIAERENKKLSTNCLELNMACTNLELFKFVEEQFNAVYVDCGVDTGGYFWTDNLFGTYVHKNMVLAVKVMSDAETIKIFQRLVEHHIKSNPCFITYVYDPDYLDSMIVPVNNNLLPYDEMYPFLNEYSLNEYYDRFLNSSANVLVLIGPPGTGKTSFIRGLLSHTRRSATLAYHEKILTQDSFFVEWLKSDDTFMVLEDSDTMIMSRADGNQMMSRFLNLGDGLISFDSKKLIFSTNLPSKTSIDDALLRPGRCFDVLEFRNLTATEAKKLAIAADKPDFDSSVAREFTVAEVFAQEKNEVKNKKQSNFGFIPQ